MCSCFTRLKFSTKCTTNIYLENILHNSPWLIVALMNTDHHGSRRCRRLFQFSRLNYQQMWRCFASAAAPRHMLPLDQLFWHCNQLFVQLHKRCSDSLSPLRGATSRLQQILTKTTIQLFLTTTCKCLKQGSKK